MGVLAIMSWRGHTEVTWDDKAVETGDPDALAAVREAERIFREERARGAVAFKVTSPNEAAERIDAFDRTAEQIVMVPRMAGG